MNQPCLSASDIAFVASLIQEAGQLAMSMRSQIAISEKAPGDLVTNADRAVSRLIVDALAQRMPDDLIVSEEGDRQQAASQRTWLIDPIDGTDHYVRNSRQFSVMIGLVVDGKPAYGWVYQPTESLLVHGGPGCGTVRKHAQEPESTVPTAESLGATAPKRIIIGRGDARNRPWLERMKGVSLKQVGSVGVKVIWILEDKADIVAQMHGRMSVWDTAGPAAIALGAGLEVGAGKRLEPELRFPAVYNGETFKQRFPIVIGRAGTLAWAREFLLERPV